MVTIKRVTHPDPVEQAFVAPAVKGEVVKRRPARNRDHPHPSNGDYYRSKAPTLPKMTAPVEKRDDKHAEAVNRNLAVLPEEMRRSEAEIYGELVENGHRSAFAALSAHQEMAATILSAGGTHSEAADYAGISKATVVKYLEDPEFRKRVGEVRHFILDRVAGRIATELDRRTDPELLADMEIQNVLRILDRVQGPKSGAGKLAESVTINNYDAIFAEISRPDASEEGADFQGYGSEVVPVPGGGSRVIRKVSGT